MPAVPLFVLELGPTRRWWRALVAGLCAAALASSLAWLLLSGGQQPMLLRIAVMVLTIAIVALAAAQARSPGGCLRWDGQRWFLSGSAPADAGLPGELGVAFDAGGWMLLRWRSEVPTGAHGSRWLAVDHRQPGVDWHALRCAVYSPRPAPGAISAADAARSSPE